MAEEAALRALMALEHAVAENAHMGDRLVASIDDVALKMGTGYSNASGLLGVLEDRGCVQSERGASGRVFYAITDDGEQMLCAVRDRHPALLAAKLQAAEQQRDRLLEAVKAHREATQSLFKGMTAEASGHLYDTAAAIESEVGN
jgi:DNA-binding MarR family transcriptional regulator